MSGDTPDLFIYSFVCWHHLNRSIKKISYVWLKFSMFFFFLSYISKFAQIFSFFFCLQKNFFFNSECNGLKALSLQSFQYHLEWFKRRKKKTVFCLVWQLLEIVPSSFMEHRANSGSIIFHIFHTVPHCTPMFHTTSHFKQLLTQVGTAHGAKDHPGVRGYLIISTLHCISYREKKQGR